ncbi:MAG: hemerythrin domain-containing protein [Methylibium sp.]|uniref:hemerythrin domain-containing protein n=1 Tax=Methylibium sp. TaxID=2067992 RepID=UPI0017BFEE65|nr:hemerythrin domain-containing protein [Methylibium sp.]MBA3598309.1 hemerythrin domain-containing protein [Methylibium sp.]
MNAIDLLTSQHRMIEANMEKLQQGGMENWDAALFAEVADHLTVHIASEEQVFYPAVKAKRTEDILLESLEEHLSLKRLLADLLELDPSAQTFEPKFKVLHEQTEHHHEEEEEHLFPKVARALDAAELEALGDKMSGLQQSLRREGSPRDAVSEQTDQASALE